MTRRIPLAAMKSAVRADAHFRLSLLLHMEIAMRHPFYMDGLDPKDRRMVKQLYGGVVVFYSILFLLVSGAVKLYAPHIDAAGRKPAAIASQIDRLTGVSTAAAAEPPSTIQCASRDLELVTSLGDHGEAQDVSTYILSAAFLALMEARAACAAGRIDEALAIYDGIIIGSAQVARK